MFRLHKLLFLCILLGTPGESHCPANRIRADATKRRNDTAERARLAAGAERRRVRKAISYAEDSNSGDKSGDTDDNSYLTAQQKRNKKAAVSRKDERKVELPRKKTPVSGKKNDSKKRGRPASQPDVASETTDVSVPKKKGRKPKILESIEEPVAITSYTQSDVEVLVENGAQVNATEDINMGELSLVTPMRKQRRHVTRAESDFTQSLEDEKEYDEWKTPKQKRDYNREERYKVREGAPRPSRDKVRKHRDGSDSDDDSEDDIPSPRNLSPCRLGPVEECPFCSAEHYPGGHICCDKGAVFVEPMRKLPKELHNLMFGNGVKAKAFRKHVLSYNNAYAFASVQYNRIPSAPHGVQSVKIQGNPGHFPSCALPDGSNDPLYGNVYLYQGRDSANMRMKVYKALNKEVVQDLEACMNRDNHFALYYRNMKELIDEQEKDDPSETDRIRMKIVNANTVSAKDLQAHKGIYRKVVQGGDHVALFFQSSVEQDVKLPGLIIYPRRNKSVIMPIFPWDPKATPLCYPVFCPYGEYAFAPKKYPLWKGEDRKMDYLSRLKKYASENLDAAKIWEVEMDVDSLLGSLAASDLSADSDVVESDSENVNIRNAVYDDEGDIVQEEEAEDFELRVVNELERPAVSEEIHHVFDRIDLSSPDDDIIDIDLNQREMEEDFYEALAPVDYPIEPREYNEENREVEHEESPVSMENDAEPEEPIDEQDNVEGEDGKESKTGPRMFASLKQYITYVYQSRKLIPNRFLRGDKLGQLFLIDNFMRMLNQRYNYIRDKCGEYMTSTKSKMLKARQKLADKLKLGITIGAQFSVPHSVPGSPRWLQQKFENAVGMCNAFGKPDLFITATCNVAWPEIKERIPKGETWADHPFLVNEVFHKKLEKLMQLLTGKKKGSGKTKKAKGIFGAVKWFTYSIEFQQRGPPHAHIVVSLKKKPKNVLQIDKLCQAALPKNNPRLRKLVEDFMIHSPCEGDPTAYCREGLNPSKILCSKGFPKSFNDVTKMGDRHYPELERPNDGECSQKNRKADNRYVVPFNAQLLTFWEGHINTEAISALGIVKYIFKYLFKGFDRALVEIATGADSLDKDAMTIDGHLLRPKNIKIPDGTLRKRREDAKKMLRSRGIPLKDQNGKKTVVYNEFWVIEDMRAVTSCEAAWEFAGYERHGASHIVVDNNIHGEGEERVTFKPDDQEKVLDSLELEELATKLKSWFTLNQKDPAAHVFTFADLPIGYIYEKGEWRPRKKKINNLVSRIKSVNPRNKELYAIRLLCMNRKGPKSFKDLRTVDGIEYPTAIEAAYALDLMNNDREWDLCLAEACNYDNPKSLRRLFCQIITSNPIANSVIRELYDKYRSYFYVNAHWDEKQQEAHVLYHIQSFLSVHGVTLEDFGLPSLNKDDLPPHSLIDDSGNLLYSQRLSRREANELRKSLNSEQTQVLNEILEGIQNGTQTAFFLQGSGGTGKTRIMQALFHEYRSQGKNVACVAQTGIAASLLPLGSTAHRLFKIPLSAEENMNSTLDHESNDAEYLKKLDLIIWDEATMADRRIYECVNKLLSTLRYDNVNKLFGGCPFVFAGDWKQTLPVVPEVHGEAVCNYTAIEWPRWNEIKVLRLKRNMRAKDDPGYAQYCAEVGSGETNINPETRAVDQLVRLPINRLVGSTKELISKIYGGVGSPAEKKDVFQKSTILAVDNKTVFDLNNKVLNLLDTQEYTFKSVDEYDPKNGFAHLDPETYHLATPSGYPLHELKIKVGAVVMLLRNINVNKGLTNGTRLIVEEIGAHIIRCTPLKKQKHMPSEILLHRVLFTPTGVLSREISFTRKQFPIRLSFAMTCNKSQGQTLDRCGLVLTTPCFSHGQLYVALSRVRREEDIVIYNAAKNPSLTNNVVFKKVFGYENRSRNGIGVSDSAGLPTTESNEVSGFPSFNRLVPQDYQMHTEEEGDSGSEASSTRFDSLVPSSSRPSHPVEDFDRIIVLGSNSLGRPASTLAVEQAFPNNKQNIILPDNQATAPLPIKNLGTTCYANSAIQTIGRLWKSRILNSFGGNVFILALKKILTGSSTRGAAPLLEIEYLPKEYRDFGKQQSSAELITTLLNFIPSELKEEVVHFHIPYYVCRACGKESSGRAASNTTWLHGATESHYETFEEYIISYTRPKTIMKSCEECQLRNPENRELWYAVEHGERWEIEIPPACKYLPIEMNVFERIHGRMARLNRSIGNPPARLELFGHVWKPIAAIWHHGNTQHEGHYKAFVEQSGHWWECDDSTVKIGEFPLFMEGIVFIVLERVNFGLEETVGIEEEKIDDDEIEMETVMSQPQGICRQIVNKTTPILLIEKNSIIEVDSDVIVNAANPRLQQGDGVDGIIRTACGPELINDATDTIRKSLPSKQLGPGQVVATDSFLLKRCKRVYHTAAPYIQPGKQPNRCQEEHLRLCYYNSLLRAEEESHVSITFPILGIGLYNYDEKKGMAIALQAIFAYFECNPLSNLKTVRIVAVSGGIVKKMQALIGGAAVYPLESTQAADGRRKLEISHGSQSSVLSSLAGCSLLLSSFLK